MNEKLKRRFIPDIGSLLLIAVLLLSANSMGQSVVSPVGTDFRNGENQLSFTVGETATSTFRSGEIILKQGFHQGSLVVTAINNTGSADLNFSAGPNPAADYLYLTTRSRIPLDSRFILTDLKGNVIRQAPVQSETTRIQMLGLSPGAYILKVYIGAGKAPFTYKILKK